MPESYHPSIDALGPIGKAVVDLFYGEAQDTFRIYKIGKSDITADGSFEDYGLEYADVLCGLSSIESSFSIDMPQGFRNINGVFKYLNRKLAANVPAAQRA